MPGSLLWNNQTQRPEWVRADEIPARLASGAYRSYESSGAVAAGTGQVVPAEGVRSFSAVGGEADDSVRGDIGAAEARRAQLDAYSGLDQKILTAVDGAVNAVSVGLVDGVDSNAGLRAAANPGSRVAGAVAGSLLSTFAPIGPSSALFAGAQRVGSGAARALTGKALDYSLRGAAAKATGMAVEGAVEAGAYAAGSQIANAINGRPVSGEAIINDIGLGAALGGAIGAPVAALGARAGRRVASVRAADDALPALRAVGDGAAVWGGAHARLEQSYKLYADLVQDGALGEGGEQLLLPRRYALQDAERARKRLFRAAGRAKDFGGVSSYMDRLVHSGKARDVQEFFGALDAYGVAVGRLDELMRPGARDADVLAGMARKVDAEGPLPDPGTTAPTPRAPERGEPVAYGPLQPESQFQGFSLAQYAHENGIPLEKAFQLSHEEIAELSRAKGIRPKEFDQPAANNTNMFPEAPVAATGAASPRALAKAPKSREALEDLEYLVNGQNQNLMIYAPPEWREAFDLGRNPDRLLELLGDDTAEVAKLSSLQKQQRVYELIKDKIKKPTDAGNPLSEVEALLEAEGPRARIAAGKGDTVDRVLAGVDDGPRPTHDPMLSWWGITDEVPLPGQGPLAFAKTVPGTPPGTVVMPRYLDAVEFWDKEARRAGFKGAPELGADMDAVLSRIDTASNGRLGSEALKAVAEELGVNLARVSGPLAERGVALWALRKIATSVSAGRGTAMHRLSRRAMEAVGGVAGWGLGGGIVGAALGREVGRIAADRVLGPVSRLVQAQGLLRLRAGDSVARMLSPRRVSRATFVALAAKPVEASYNPDNPRRTRKFEEKAEDLRAAMGNPERVRERIRENTRELALVDPMGALNAEDVAITRLQNLHRRLPKFMLPAMLGQPIPPPVDEIAEWELYEAITNDPTLAAQLVSAGRIDDTIVEALAEQHPEFRAEMLKAVLERREELERADHRTQAALGRLLGLNLVPEVDPAYVQRVQIDYDEQAEERAAKTPQPGAAGMSPNQLPGAIPTPAIVYATPVPNR